MSPDRHRRVSAWLFPFTLALLPALFFPRVALLSRTFYSLDLPLSYVPQRRLAFEMIKEGVLPLWDPYVFGGMPLLANIQTGLFYPPNWLFLVLGAPEALGIYTLIQFSIAGVGTYFFAVTSGLARHAAFAAALAYMFSGCIAGRIVHPDVQAASALLPLLLGCAARAIKSNSLQWTAGLSAAITIQAVGGHPQIVVYSAIALLLYGLVMSLGRLREGQGWRAAGTPLALLAGSYAGAALLGAIQFIPFLELLQESMRARGVTEAFVYSGALEREHLLLFLFPYMRGGFSDGIYSNPRIPYLAQPDVWERLSYIGILPLYLAAAMALFGVAACGKRRPPLEERHGEWFGGDRWFLLFLPALAAGGLLLAVSRPSAVLHLISAMPLLGRFRQPARAMVLVQFALAMMAGLALQVMSQRTLWQQHWMRVSLRSVAVLALVVAPALVVLLHTQSGAAAFHLDAAEDVRQHLQWTRPNVLVPVSLSALTGVLLWRWSRKAPGPGSIGLALVLVCIDSYLFCGRLFPQETPAIYRPLPAAAKLLQADSGLFRKATLHEGLEGMDAAAVIAPQWGQNFRIQDVNGFSSLQSRRYTDYLFSIKTEMPSSGHLRDARLLNPRNPVLNMLNVKYVLIRQDSQLRPGPPFEEVFIDPQVRIYRNPNAYLRAWFASAVRLETDPARVLRAVISDGFDGRALALVEDGDPAELTGISPALPSDAVWVRRYSPNEIILETSAEGARFLVLSEMYFPGWQALVDGKPVRIYRSNYLFRGVRVGPGRQEITLRYRPRSVLVGAVISGLACLVLLYLAAMKSRAMA